MRRVIVNGTFDILHPGHIELLNYAKSCGDYLLVAIDTDERVRSLKPGRPINCQQDRQLMLANLRAVDQVELFNSDQELEDLVKTCDLMIKGSDYQGKPIVGQQYIEVEFYERTKHSTTQTIQDIINRR